MKPPNPLIVKPFFAYAESLLKRRFDGVGIAQGSLPAFEKLCASQHALIYSTHSSWWDVMIGILIAKRTGLELRAPMEQKQLEKYSILRSIGMLGVSESNSLSFMRNVNEIFSGSRRSGLWITPQAHFACNREPQPPFKRGLELIARQHPNVPVFAIAINYEFWNESRPVAVLSIEEVQHADSEQLRNDLDGLTTTLLAASSQRERQNWQWLLDPKPASVWIQDATAQLKSWVTRRSYQAGHLR